MILIWSSQASNEERPVNLECKDVFTLKLRKHAHEAAADQEPVLTYATRYSSQASHIQSQSPESFGWTKDWKNDRLAVNSINVTEIAPWTKERRNASWQVVAASTEPCVPATFLQLFLTVQVVQVDVNTHGRRCSSHLTASHWLWLLSGHSSHHWRRQIIALSSYYSL